MINYAYKILDDINDAEDAVQETFTRLCLYSDKLMSMPENEILSYVFKTVHNTSITILNRKKGIETAEDSELEIHLTAAESAESEAVSSMSFENTIEAAASIDPEYGNMVRLKYEQDKKTTDIACELGRPADSMRVLLSRMRKRLKKKLAGDVDYDRQQNE